MFMDPGLVVSVMGGELDSCELVNGVVVVPERVLLGLERCLEVVLVWLCGCAPDGVRRWQYSRCRNVYVGDSSVGGG